MCGTPRKNHVQGAGVDSSHRLGVRVDFSEEVTERRSLFQARKITKAKALG